MPKGPNFERWLCGQLSLWWTQDLAEPRDDCFWRTSNSGGRATTRSKSSKRTHGQYGDICATDPIGQPLIDLLTVEVKRGYSRSTFADLIDKPAHAKKQQYEVWFEKAQKDSEAAGSYGWLLITKRDRRVPLVFMSKETAGMVIGYDDVEFGPSGNLEFIQNEADDVIIVRIVYMTLNEWLQLVTPKEIIGMAAKHKRIK